MGHCNGTRFQSRDCERVTLKFEVLLAISIALSVRLYTHTRTHYCVYYTHTIAWMCKLYYCLFDGWRSWVTRLKCRRHKGQSEKARAQTSSFMIIYGYRAHTPWSWGRPHYGGLEVLLCRPPLVGRRTRRAGNETWMIAFFHLDDGSCPQN